jgi:hypothetical protein
MGEAFCLLERFTPCFGIKNPLKWEKNRKGVIFYEYATMEGGLCRRCCFFDAGCSHRRGRCD